jgi:hypothetical protein
MGAAAGDALSLSNCTSTLFSRTTKKVGMLDARFLMWLPQGGDVT